MDMLVFCLEHWIIGSFVSKCWGLDMLTVRSLYFEGSKFMTAYGLAHSSKSEAWYVKPWDVQGAHGAV